MSLIETLGINVVLLSFLMYIDFNYFNFNFNFITTLITLNLTLYLASFTVALLVSFILRALALCPCETGISHAAVGI